MENIDLTDIIKSLEQPSFDDEMIKKIMEGFGDDYYHHIRNINAMSRDNSGILNEDEVSKLWQLKSPGEKQGGHFQHIGSEKDIDYCFTRLYINCCKKDIIQLATLFTERCNSSELPVCFKYSINDADYRTDQIVIYSNLGNLQDYIQILQDIKQQHPEIIERCGEPPLFTGKYDGWIGVGDEPNVRNTSFNVVRSQAIDRALSKLATEIEGVTPIEYELIDVDVDTAREAIRKEFESIGIDMDNCAFNKENIELYMANSQIRQQYDSERRQKINDNRRKNAEHKKLEPVYLKEQTAYFELKILQQLGQLPEGMESLIQAGSNRSAFLTDFTMKKADVLTKLQQEFGLSQTTRMSEKFRIEKRDADGWIDLPLEDAQELSSKILNDITNYYTNFFNEELSTIDETLSRYSELESIQREEDENIEIMDLDTKLKMFAEGKPFFEKIGIPSEKIEKLCDRAQSFLQDLEQKREEKERPESQARKSMIDREYLQTVFEEAGTTDIAELRRIYEENREFLDMSDEDLEAVLSTFSDNGTINPSQIGSDTVKSGLGLVYINQSTKEVRKDLTYEQTAEKSGETRS